MGFGNIGRGLSLDLKTRLVIMENDDIFVRLKCKDGKVSACIIRQKTSSEQAVLDFVKLLGLSGVALENGVWVVRKSLFEIEKLFGISRPANITEKSFEKFYKKY